MATTPTKKINVVIYFENLTIRWYVFYNKFYFLCIILNYKNLKFKHLIDNITINFLSF